MTINERMAMIDRKLNDDKRNIDYFYVNKETLLSRF
jgi:hypothetical protein